MTRRLTPMIAAALLAGSLAGCGLTGDLQRPDPLFGEPDGREAAALPDRAVERGLPDRPGAEPGDDETDTDETVPNADDELLGGPGGS